MKRISISEAEWQIMEIIWDCDDPISSHEILTRIKTSSDWSEGTVRSLLNRMCRKGAVTAERKGRRYLYSAARERDECLKQESTAFLNRFFKGELTPMMACFLGEETVSEEDLDELDKLIEEKRKGLK